MADLIQITVSRKEADLLANILSRIQVAETPKQTKKQKLEEIEQRNLATAQQLMKKHLFKK